MAKIFKNQPQENFVLAISAQSTILLIFINTVGKAAYDTHTLN